MAPRLLTLADAADYLGMIPGRLRRLVTKHCVPHVMLPDGEPRFDAADLDVWVREHRQCVPPDAGEPAEATP